MIGNLIEKVILIFGITVNSKEIYIVSKLFLGII